MGKTYNDIAVFSTEMGKDGSFHKKGERRNFLLCNAERSGAYQQNVNGMDAVSDCRQKAILPLGGRIALSANERIAEFLDFAIQAKFAYVNKLKRHGYRLIRAWSIR